MNTTLILTGAAAFFIGALFAWLITRYQAQSRHFTVLQELAEARRLHEFAEQVQAQTTADLAQSRHTVQELQDELQETGNRFAAAEKQIAYLQDCEAEAETLKHECAKWQQSAQNLQINNERLNTQLVQEQALSADKNTLLQQQETEKGRLKQDYDTLLEQNHALQVQNERLSTQLTQEKANIDDKNSLLQQQEAEKGRLKQEYAALLEQNHALQVQNERLNTQSEKDRQAAEEKLALLADARQNLSDQFQNLANTILEEKSRRFTEQNHDHLQQLLNPLNERIHGFSELIQQTYEKEAKERLTIENELKRLQTLNTQLHHDAKALTTALTGTQNKTQGNWGEMILESVLENSGLQKGREYIVQASSVRHEADGTQRRLQPDVLINLPDNKQIVIDSKVSLTAYVRYTQSTGAEAERELANHVASIRAHIKSLAAKDYTDLEGVKTLDFVFMFVPVEPAYLLALQHDPNLFQECFDKRIMLTGPSTLLATLRTVANIWRNEQQNQNALAIAEAGSKLYDKFVGFVESMDGINKALGQAQSQFQTAYSRLVSGRGNLISSTEKLRKLGIKAGKQLQRDLVEKAVSETEDHAALPTTQNQEND
ncbi:MULTISPECIES: DNA recombination protein RmuC [Neisseria]|uniref:DNA recombination protein n=1 Tax=Neisseria mucosa C102 TaxID=435832 RepID=A0ABP2KGR8_NEIMU|nr:MULTISPECIES: DNA recombination protein RmuC [Neisseria]EFV80015.1 DNA recombination protein [Neisseria mucosa C102]OFM21671.1 recombinase RmuC [Neisseria sp. HMSC070A01]QKI22646.1 DNA recombination protein RmuC [Neisseria mucosa]